jgi:hypothetical protein
MVADAGATPCYLELRCSITLNLTLADRTRAYCLE